MDGVSWDERQPNDWLASNGRWYPAGSYPRGWRASALPPAPEHDLGSGWDGIVPRPIHGTNPTPSSPAWSDGQSSSTGSDSTTSPNSPPSSSGSSSGSRFVGGSVRPVADATVTSHQTYANKVGPAPKPPPALAPPQAPGRLSTDTQSLPPPQTPPPPEPRIAAEPPAPNSDLAVVAGDLGLVLGAAKRRIDTALGVGSQDD